MTTRRDIRETTIPAHTIAHEFPYRSIDEVRKANADRGHHYFDPDTLRFFRSRIGDTIHGGRYFVTSEQGPTGPRAYSVREAMPDGSVQSVGTFMEYATGREATRRARELAKVEGSEHAREVVRDWRTYQRERPEQFGPLTVEAFRSWCSGYGLTDEEIAAAIAQVDAEEQQGEQA